MAEHRKPKEEVVVAETAPVEAVALEPKSLREEMLEIKKMAVEMQALLNDLPFSNVPSVAQVIVWIQGQFESGKV